MIPSLHSQKRVNGTEPYSTLAAALEAEPKRKAGELPAVGAFPFYYDAAHYTEQLGTLPRRVSARTAPYHRLRRLQAGRGSRLCRRLEVLGSSPLRRTLRLSIRTNASAHVRFITCCKIRRRRSTVSRNRLTALPIRRSTSSIRQLKRGFRWNLPSENSWRVTSPAKSRAWPSFWVVTLRVGLRNVRVTFVLPGAGSVPVGGFKVVYEYANRLSERGHTVTVVHTAQPDRQASTRERLKKACALCSATSTRATDRAGSSCTRTFRCCGVRPRQR